MTAERSGYESFACAVIDRPIIGIAVPISLIIVIMSWHLRALHCSASGGRPESCAPLASCVGYDD